MERISRKDLLKRVVSGLSEDGVCKTVSAPKSHMYIIDEDGVKHKLVLKRDERTVKLDEKDVAEVVNHLIDAIVGYLSEGVSVGLTNFGTFSIRRHSAHTVRNVSTGELIRLKPTYRIKFTPGQKIKTIERLITIAANEDEELRGVFDEEQEQDADIDE